MTRRRDPVRQQAQRNGQEQKGERLHGGKETDLAGPRTEHEHCHQWHCGQTELLGGLRGQVGEGQVLE
jgi:hypothetical protein